MFCTKNRLTKTKEIDLVFKQGQSAFSLELGIKALNNKLPQNRFAILVSTKVDKRATERNLIKRRIRAALKKLIFSLPKKYDIVVVAKAEIKQLSYQEIEARLEKLLKKLH